MIEPIRILSDGTIKQVNPFSGTQVWTVPGRGHRLKGGASGVASPVDSDEPGHYCAFCEKRYFETPPEKVRVVRLGDRWERVEGALASELDQTVAEFRRVPNLFEILSIEYWHQNHGHQMPDSAKRRMENYLAEPQGDAHVWSMAKTKAKAAGMADDRWESLPREKRLAYIANFFNGGHDVIIARKHFVDGPDSGLASSGCLSPEEHYQFVRFTTQSMRELYGFSSYVRYVSAFQNWLRPAGATFDHLHKQLVAIDEHGVRASQEAKTVSGAPNIYNELAVDKAMSNGLLLAENDHAVAFAGFGHRYPTLEVFSKSSSRIPWEHSDEEIRAMSDLLHACHAATGANIPTNEEWYHEPPDMGVAMPWRILLKWRIATLAGFEGGTKININTVSPFTLRNRVLPELVRLRETKKIAPMRLGAECDETPNRLRYLDG